MSRCKDPLEREFYIRMARKFGWTRNVLIHQIENQSYEKTLLGQTNFDRALAPGLRAQAKLAVRDEYTFDFLELGEEHSERDLEAERLRVDHWREKEATRDAVRLTIYDFLWNDSTGLPVDRYTGDDVEVRAEDVYCHIYQVYPTLPSPFYGEEAAV